MSHRLAAPHAASALPTTSIFRLRGMFVTIDEPSRTDHCHPKCYMGFATVKKKWGRKVSATLIEKPDKMLNERKL